MKTTGQPWENIVTKKKKPQLHLDWSRLGADANTLNIPYGTVTMTDDGTGVETVYKLDPVYVELLKLAYMWGLQNNAPW